MDIQKYLSESIANMMKDAARASKGNWFMVRFGVSSRLAARRRAASDIHVPPFLIASITSSCNLHCAGCYSRAIDTCNDNDNRLQLEAEAWNDIFKEARDLGIAFAFLAGGEPLIRSDIIQTAGKHQDILFPIITNGLLINDSYVNMFKKYPNLIPIISVEGKKENTDGRRGEGMYETISEKMNMLKENRILFGSSITVTTENVTEIMSDDFITELNDKGSKVVLFIEYVPVTKESAGLAPTTDTRAYMEERMTALREKYVNDSLFIAFPGDEAKYGGCLGAGRGFFHINYRGDAEACPFSPVAAVNVHETSLRDAIESKLFASLTSSDLLNISHEGGCALFGRDEQVKEYK